MKDRAAFFSSFLIDGIASVFVFFLSLNQKKIFLCKCYNVFVIVNLG